MFLNLECRILFHTHFDHLKNSLVFGWLLFSWWTKGIFAAHYFTIIIKHSYFRRLCVHIWSEREKMSECWTRSIDIDIGTGNDWRCPLIKTSPFAGKNHNVNFLVKIGEKYEIKCAISLFYSNYQTFLKTQKLQRMTAMLPLSS